MIQTRSQTFVQGLFNRNLICPQNSRPFLNSSNIWLISTQQPQMAFSCSGLTLKLHVLERPCMFSFMISILNDFCFVLDYVSCFDSSLVHRHKDCVQRWCDEKGNTNLSFFCLYIQIVKILEGLVEEGFTPNHSPPPPPVSG
ncbi:hypothetical protein HanIR_Chr09g0401361 [Helianthus annuus]|nr:hypothetical protein HanIR_Chr09g0401361 [Helianthus annuus]